jgi:4-amino-4-deoxy-L-arabinose transferase-like glycosyltransferase
MNTNKYDYLLTDKNAVFFIIFLAIIHALFNTTIQLNVDEAYYWVWSTKLQLSYYDHPPMVAYLIKLFTLPGDSEFFVRLPAVFCMSLSAWYVYLLSKEVFDRQVAWIVLITGAVLPATNMGYTIITPDAPLILFWSSSLYYSYKALFEDKWKYYILAGIHIGLLMLSKYTSVLFLGFLLLYILYAMPKKLLTLKPWISIIIAFIVFSPVLIWNYQNDWISFTFQYHHGTSKAFRIRFDKFFEFIGGLFAIFTPIFFSILLYGTFKYKDWLYDKKRLYIVLSYLFPLIFFMYKALFKKMELNWVAIAFISAMILFAYTVKQYKFIKSYKVGFVIALLATIVIHFPTLFLPAKYNIHNRISGYKEVVIHMQQYIKPGDYLFADRLNRAAIFTYYTKGHPRTYIPTPTRVSSYTFWDKGIDFSKMKGIYYSPDDEMRELKKVFKNVKLIERYVVKKKGFKDKVFYIYRVS